MNSIATYLIGLILIAFFTGCQKQTDPNGIAVAGAVPSPVQSPNVELGLTSPGSLENEVLKAKLSKCIPTGGKRLVIERSLSGLRNMVEKADCRNQFIAAHPLHESVWAAAASRNSILAAGFKGLIDLQMNPDPQPARDTAAGAQRAVLEIDEWFALESDYRKLGQVGLEQMTGLYTMHALANLEKSGVVFAPARPTAKGDGRYDSEFEKRTNVPALFAGKILDMSSTGTAKFEFVPKGLTRMTVASDYSHLWYFPKDECRVSLSVEKAVFNYSCEEYVRGSSQIVQELQKTIEAAVLQKVSGR